jgi:hypothetical protein
MIKQHTDQCGLKITGTIGLGVAMMGVPSKPCILPIAEIHRLILSVLVYGSICSFLLTPSLFSSLSASFSEVDENKDGKYEASSSS